MNYLIGITWLICLFLFFYTVGCAFSKQNRCGPFKILTGYIVYSLGVAIPGIAVQILNLDYILFRNLMWGWIVFLSIVSTFMVLRRRVFSSITKAGIVEFIKKYWALSLIIIGVLFLTAINYQAFWLGNRSDDGFYLSRIAGYPVVKNPFEHDLATGLYTGHVINSYSLNTHDLESSVFFQFLGIPIGLFARVFLAAESVIIFAFCIYGLAYEIICKDKKAEKYKYIIQFVPGILFLFTSNFVFLANSGILDIQDSWQTSTAMYFGSSIVRTSGFFLLLLPFIKEFKLDWRIVLEVMGISLVLISKSTIAVPLIFVTVISYLLLWLIYNRQVNKFILIIFIIALATCGILLTNFLSFESYGFDSISTLESNTSHFLNNLLHSIVPWICFAGVLSGVLTRKFKILLLQVLIFAFLFIPALRTYACALSFYTFVIGRVISAYVYFLISTLLSLILCYFCRCRIRPGILSTTGFILTGLLAGMNVVSYMKYGGDAGIVQGSSMVPTTVQNSLEVLKKNPEFMPSSTVDLASALNELQKSKGKLAVLTETYYISDGVSDLKHILTRSLAPDVIFPAANTRFITDDDPVYGSYSVEQQAVFEKFLLQNDEASTQSLKELLDTYQIDAIVLRDGEVYNSNLNQIGFSLYKTINDDDGHPAYFLYAR